MSQLHPAVVLSMQTWHRMIETRDLSDLPSIVHPDATFRSPMAFKPYQSREAVVLILSTVITIFENFEYHRQFATEDGLNVALEFSADVGDKSLKGIDMIRFDEDGLITDFEVMIRPLNGLQALGTEMGARLAQYLPAYKG
ncbi:nuclear transport factor 2 family protein [Brevundimonas aveniformis]|uniref:nuclear transport factor 2 family protein n=1 Tax=Brevundimonas aveniformis TaxID=370977 RepID=UPI00040DC225|nr:nuclear transport factor 2 family protein [Brevundimonas aveniformis]